MFKIMIPLSNFVGVASAALARIAYKETSLPILSAGHPHARFLGAS
jgi:hypothetical protein